MCGMSRVLYVSPGLARVQLNRWKKKVSSVQYEVAIHLDYVYVEQHFSPFVPSPESASSVSESDDDETDMTVTSLDEFQKAAGPLAAGGIPDALTKAKQSRGEKKARKVFTLKFRLYRSPRVSHV